MLKHNCIAGGTPSILFPGYMRGGLHAAPYLHVAGAILDAHRGKDVPRVLR